MTTTLPFSIAERVSKVNYTGSDAWNPEPFQIVSLWDMITTFPVNFFWIMNAFGWFEPNEKSSNPKADNDTLSDDDLKLLKSLVVATEMWCKECELTASGHRVKWIAQRVVSSHPLTYGAVRQEIGTLNQALKDDLEGLPFFYIPKSQIHTYQQEKLFGNEVYDKFPSAQSDIKEAGNCYAMGRYTACVFHLMRTLEVAVKTLWKSLNLNPDSVPNDWGGYLAACDDVLKEREKTRLRATIWGNDEDSLRDATRELQQIKKLWRNPTMHVVNNYGEGETADIFQSVRVFMQHISKKLSEVPEI